MCLGKATDEHCRMMREFCATGKKPPPVFKNIADRMKDLVSKNTILKFHEFNSGFDVESTIPYKVKSRVATTSTKIITRLAKFVKDCIRKYGTGESHDDALKNPKRFRHVFMGLRINISTYINTRMNTIIEAVKSKVRNSIGILPQEALKELAGNNSLSTCYDDEDRMLTMIEFIGMSLIELVKELAQNQYEQIRPIRNVTCKSKRSSIAKPISGPSTKIVFRDSETGSIIDVIKIPGVTEGDTPIIQNNATPNKSIVPEMDLVQTPIETSVQEEVQNLISVETEIINSEVTVVPEIVTVPTISHDTIVSLGVVPDVITVTSVQEVVRVITQDKITAQEVINVPAVDDLLVAQSKSPKIASEVIIAPKIIAKPRVTPLSSSNTDHKVFGKLRDTHLENILAPVGVFKRDLGRSLASIGTKYLSV